MDTTRLSGNGRHLSITCVVTFLFCALPTNFGVASDKASAPSASRLVPPNDLSGAWHYRSFVNDSKSMPDLNTILFGEGDFELDESATGVLSGIGDFGSGDTVKVEGSVSHGNWITVRFHGVGTGLTNKDWVYDYVGVLVPPWPNGVNQVQALVGSVVRSAPHSNGSGGTAPAGRVASFVAVKK